MTMTPAEGVRHHEARRRLAEDFGKKAFASVEANEKEMQRIRGAQDGLREGRQRIEEHKAFWKMQLEEHKVEPEEVKIIYRTIDECIGIMQNLDQGAVILTYKLQGAQAEAESMRAHAQSVFDNEVKAMQMVIDDAKNPPASDSARQVGQHPGPSLAERRREAEENGMRVVEGGSDHESEGQPLTPKPKRRRKGVSNEQDS